MFLVYFFYFRGNNCSIFQELGKINLSNTFYINISDKLSVSSFLENFLLAYKISLSHSFTVLEAFFPEPPPCSFLGLLSAAS